MLQWAGGNPPPGFLDWRWGRWGLKWGNSASPRENWDLPELCIEMRGGRESRLLRRGTTDGHCPAVMSLGFSRLLSSKADMEIMIIARNFHWRHRFPRWKLPGEWRQKPWRCECYQMLLLSTHPKFSCIFFFWHWLPLVCQSLFLCISINFLI